MNDKNILNEQESLLVRECVKNAYPQPSVDIRQAVMRRIKAERAIKRRRTANIAKWGSIAAVIMIVVGLGIRALPMRVGNDSVVRSAENAGAFLAEEKTENAMLLPAEDEEVKEEADIEIFAYDNCMLSAGSEPQKGSAGMYGAESPSGSLYRNSVGLEIPSEYFASAVIDVDGDGAGELVVLKEIDGDRIGIYAEKNGETVYEGGVENVGASYSFEHIDGLMILRAYRNEDSSVRYFRIELSGTDGTLVLMPYDVQ